MINPNEPKVAGIRYENNMCIPEAQPLKQAEGSIPASAGPAPVKTDSLSFSKISRQPLKQEMINKASDKSSKKERLEIFIYPTYGTDQEVTIKGRVLEAEKQRPVKESDSRLRNLLNNINFFDSDEIENASVDIKFNGKIVKVKTDDDGFFVLKTKEIGHVNPGFNEVQVSLSREHEDKYTANVAKAKVAIQAKNDSSFGVISDIDDTIQKSEVTSKKKLIKNIFTKNHLTQEKIKGMPELFQALDKANDGKVDGDIAYVTGSPVNLGPRIENFIKHNNFPEGPIDLKNLGSGDGADSLTKQIEYKVGKIRNLFDTYPDKSFLLFGDSGEKDPEVYKQIAKEYPGRVSAIYINNVTGDTKNSARYEGMLLTNDTGEAAADLLKRGLIKNEDYETVKKALGK